MRIGPFVFEPVQKEFPALYVLQFSSDRLKNKYYAIRCRNIRVFIQILSYKTLIQMIQ